MVDDPELFAAIDIAGRFSTKICPATPRWRCTKQTLETTDPENAARLRVASMMGEAGDVAVVGRDDTAGSG